MTRKNNYYLDFIKEISPSDLLPGAKELLDEMRYDGYKIALGSASKNAREVIDRLGIEGLFDAIADGGSVERQKPAPDLFLQAAALLGLSPVECMVVEDAEAGVEAALAGGFWCVGLGPELRVGKAHVILPSLHEARIDDLLAPLKQAPFEGRSTRG
jgi:HAD superfamily hydrolase (TIGR01509 family)